MSHSAHGPHPILISKTGTSAHWAHHFLSNFKPLPPGYSHVRYISEPCGPHSFKDSWAVSTALRVLSTACGIIDTWMMVTRGEDWLSDSGRWSLGRRQKNTFLVGSGWFCKYWYLERHEWLSRVSFKSFLSFFFLIIFIRDMLFCAYYFPIHGRKKL